MIDLGTGKFVTVYPGVWTEREKPYAEEYFAKIKELEDRGPIDVQALISGKIEKGEDPDETILREAVEETGYSVKNIKKLGSIIPTCGYCSERIHLYYGEADEKIGQHFDPDERIDLKRYTYKQIAEMISNGQIDDAKTIAVMYHLKNEGIDG